MRMHRNRAPSSGRPHNKNGSESGDIDFVVGVGAGPTSQNGSSKEEEEGGGGAGHGEVSAARTPQPLTATAIESPGVMAAYLRCHFTSSQWQEFERQALIYKYMMASAPVPPDLLMPIGRHFSDTAAAPHSTLARSSCFNLRFSSGMDPEPGRCRRTDGKKWRCARDAAPDQKYCERHMHRGRPRSRKPVELHLRADINNIDGNYTRSAPITPPETASASVPNITSNNTTTNHQRSGLFFRSDFKASTYDYCLPLASFEEPRGVDWRMKGEAIPIAASNQQWPQLMHSKANASAYRQPYEGESSLNFYSNFGAREGSETHHQNDQCFLFLNPEISSLGEPSSPEKRQTPMRFIDAWSSPAERNTGNNSSICSDGSLPPSALTLSMPRGNVSNEDKDPIQMGLGVTASSSWTPSPPGGPLAEVLRPTAAHGCCGDDGGCSGKSRSCGCGVLNLITSGWGTSGDKASSPAATTVSSPSEVLQQTLASVSDGSGSSSPTFKAAAVKSDIAFQWLNQAYWAQLRKQIEQCSARFLKDILCKTLSQVRMGCVSSTLLDHEDELSQLGRPGLGHHIVSLTSTTYGLLNLDPPSPPPPLSPSPHNDDLPHQLPNPPRSALATLFQSPLKEPMFLRSQPPEVINSWELMAGLDTDSFRFSPTITPTPIPAPSKPHQPSPSSLLRTVTLSELESRISKPPKPFPFKHQLMSSNKENTNPNRPHSTTASPNPSNVFRPMNGNSIADRPSSSKYSLNDELEKRCPPNGESKVVVYTTTIRGVRKTFEDCNAVRAVLEGIGVLINERDISMDRGFREELRELMNGKESAATVPPRVFVNGRYIGGAEEILRIHEEGCLGQLVEGLPKAARVGALCEGCGGVRFLPCFGCDGSCKLVMVVKEQGGEVVVRCPDCNENGLVLCPICS
ncbi:hypothetical protein NE237_030836 [Protea cynaroides]|uniref:Growth-regulating factor n=1 Tax=Protea cynaroides TaxID=273540 RepID=A0A9Q0JV90_9MAGN|nr:hypothetical protein NE237_030836 [Protea cynaroides]